ncbi:MAG: fibronectin type III domain-containing protein [Coriobacteriales bacterium]
MFGDDEIPTSDYTVSYSNNTNAGTATVTVTGTGTNVTGSKSATFAIDPFAISDSDVSIAQTQYTFDGTSKEPAVTVTSGGKTLAAGTDYTVSYSNNVNVGTGTVTVKGTGNYSGTVTKEFTIAAKDLSDATVNSIADQTYTGSAIEPAVTVEDGSTTLADGTDYTVSYGNNTNAGTAAATVTGKGNYSGTITKNFTINPKDIADSDVTVAAIDDKGYTGQAVEPAVTVSYGSSKLSADTDYTVEYSNNTNVGTATATVTGKGNFTGTVTRSFKIKASITQATINVNSDSYTYTGKAITPEPTVTLGTQKLVKGNDYSVEYKENVNAGTATITVLGLGNYADSKTATFTIAPKALTNSNVSDVADQTYTGSAIEPAVTVEDGSTTLADGTDYTVSYGNNTNAGTAAATVTGKGNYSGTITKNFTIAAADIAGLDWTVDADDYSDATPTISAAFNGKALVQDTDFTIEYPTCGESGTYTANVKGANNFTGSKELEYLYVTKQDAEVLSVVNDAISNIPAIDNLTLEDSEVVEQAQEKYNKLDDEQKKLIDQDTVTKLNQAVTKIKELEDEKAASAVTSSISGLGAIANLTLDDADAVNKAKEAYDALTDDQKKLVSAEDAKKLDNAVAKIKELEAKDTADKNAASEAAGTIEKLPAADTLTLDDADAVEAAQAAYDALTPDQKALVTQTDKDALDAATTKMNSLKAGYIAKATVRLSGTKFTYSGKTIKPGVTVAVGTDKLVAGKDYLVSYSANKSVGTAKATVTYIGKWASATPKTLNFKINPKGTKIKKLTRAKRAFTVKWSKNRVQTTGYQIRYSLKKSMKKSKTKTVKKNKTTKLKVKKLKSKKKYYVQVRTYKVVKGKKYYSSWSKSKKVKTK